MIKLYNILEAIKTGDTVYITKNNEVSVFKINRNRVKSKGHTTTIIHGTVTDYSMIRAGLSLQDTVSMYYYDNNKHYIIIGGENDTNHIKIS